MTDLKEKMKQSLLVTEDEMKEISVAVDSLIDNTISEFLVLMNESSEDVISKYWFIPINVFKARFIRLEREGVSSYSQSEQSISYNLNDFNDYLNIIDDYKESKTDSFGVGYQWF